MQMRVLGVLAGSSIALWGSGALAFDACPDGVTTTASPDGTSYSSLFDNLVAFAGDIASCSFSFPIETDAPSGNIIIYSADYRGGYEVDPGETLDVRIEQDGNDNGFSVKGPDLQDPYLHSTLAYGTNGEVAIDAEVDVRDADPSGFTFGTIDTADYTELGRITTPTDQTAAIVHLGATAGLLTGSLEPMEDDNYVGIIGGYGSYMFGANGHYNISDGFSILGGVSLVNQTAGASQVNGVLGAVAVRYVEPGLNSFRPLAEGGLVVGALDVDYPNVATNVATGLGTIYGKAGFVSDIDQSSQFALYATLAETGLNSDAFTQTFPGFTVNTPAQTGFFTTAKATAALTTELAPTVDLTAEASAGMVFSHSGMQATIPGLGTVSGSQNSAFVDYGVRLGWQPDPMVKLELFGQGSIGQDAGMHNQIGASAKLKF